jgi:hypothetical protein
MRPASWHNRPWLCSSFTRREGFAEDRGRGQASRSIAFSLHSAERSGEGSFGDTEACANPFMGRTGRNGRFDNQQIIEASLERSDLNFPPRARRPFPVSPLTHSQGLILSALVLKTNPGKSVRLTPEPNTNKMSHRRFCIFRISSWRDRPNAAACRQCP